MIEKLEILIIEDKEENRKAAEEFFSTRNDISVDFATTYNEGLKKLQEGFYAFGIFDLELPRTENAKPENLGFDLGREATKYLMPWAVITAGVDHHKCEAAFVGYCWDRNRKSDSYPTREITETPKSNPRSWKKVYETLVEKIPYSYVSKMVKKRKSSKKDSGKPYTLDFKSAEDLFKISAKVV